MPAPPIRIQRPPGGLQGVGWANPPGRLLVSVDCPRCLKTDVYVVITPVQCLFLKVVTGSLVVFNIMFPQFLIMCTTPHFTIMCVSFHVFIFIYSVFICVFI